MRDELRCLPREYEVVRRLIAPRLHGLERRRAIERAVDLGARKLLTVPGKPILFRHVLRIEWPTPSVVGPPRSTNPNALHTDSASPGRLAATRIGACNLHTASSLRLGRSGPLHL